jgi:uncharacterized membrane protein YccC
MNHVLKWLGAIAILALATAVVVLASRNRAQATELADLREQSTQLETLQEETREMQRLRNQVQELDRFRREAEEVHKLRNETRQLRQEKQEFEKISAELQQLRQTVAQLRNVQAEKQQIEQILRNQMQQTAQNTPPAPPTPEDAATRACINNLRQIDGGKEQWALENNQPAGAQVSPAELEPYFVNGMPSCPSGGSYTIGTLGQSPTCSIPGHALQ